MAGFEVQNFINKILERCLSGRKEPPAKRLIWETGSLGSNPSLSAIFCCTKNGEISPKGGSAVFNEMYYLYILLNESRTRTYTGVAEDVEKRLKEHNSGRVKSSHPYRPYKVVHKEHFPTLREARQREKFYKSTTGRRVIKEKIFKY